MVASGLDACRKALTAPEYRGLVSEVLSAKIARNPEVQALLGAFPADQREHFERLLTASIEQFVARGAAVSTWAKQVFVHLDEQIDLREMARAGQGSALLREPPADAVRRLRATTWLSRWHDRAANDWSRRSQATRPALTVGGGGGGGGEGGCGGSGGGGGCGGCGSGPGGSG